MIRLITILLIAVAVSALSASSLSVARNSQNARMAYLELTELKGKIPDADLVAALDDDRDGVVDSAVWAQIQTDVQTEIDGTLGQRYEVPFTAPLPAVVKLAALRF